MEFWIEVELYKRIKDSSLCLEEAKRIYFRYLSHDSEVGLNVDGKLIAELDRRMEESFWDQRLFNNLQDDVYVVLKFECVRTFWTSKSM